MCALWSKTMSTALNEITNMLWKKAMDVQLNKIKSVLRNETLIKNHTNYYNWIWQKAHYWTKQLARFITKIQMAFLQWDQKYFLHVTTNLLSLCSCWYYWMCRYLDQNTVTPYLLESRVTTIAHDEEKEEEHINIFFSICDFTMGVWFLYIHIETYQSKFYC